MKVALTGITGNMGQETLKQVLKIDKIDTFRLFVLPDDKKIKKLLKQHRADKGRIEVVYGNLKEKSDCEKFVQGADYVVHMAAVIPPASDKYPQKAVDCNETGAYNLVSAIEKLEKQPKYIHISTVALYGNRNSKRLWARVGDPLLVSPYDVYAVTKLRGEFRVLESGIKNWVVLRQSAMLHKNMLSDNISDGLMFHTCYNAPLEWVTARDSGVLIANILRRDLEENLSDIFWKKCFNIGSLAENRITGYDTLNDGFALIGGTGKDFFKPYYNSVRNFHGVWFFDGDKLEKLFNYQKQSVSEYWQEIARTHKYYGIAKILPKSLIGTLVIKRLFKSPNSPAYWAKHEDECRMTAYFRGSEEYRKLGSDWKKFPLLIENKDEKGNSIDYQALKDIKKVALTDLGFDYDKADDEIDLADLQNVAALHGGELVSKEYSGDIYQKLDWKTQDGEIFTASVFSVMRAGHWYNRIYKEYVWDFDRLSKKDKIFAGVWYDSHETEENCVYGMDGNFFATIER